MFLIESIMKKGILSTLLNPQSKTLLFRQLLMVLRRSHSFWLMGIALFVIGFGFTVAYNKYTQQKFANAYEIQMAGRLLLASYRTFSLFTLALLTPIVGVHAISQERESGTLDLMLTSAIHPLEFAFSKVIVSFTAIFTAILGTFPLLALILSMGAVEPKEVIVLGAMQVFVSVVSLCIGIAMGARMPSFIMGVASAYAITFTFIFLTTGSGRFENVGRMIPWTIVVLIVTHYLMKGVPYYLTREINRVKPKSWRPIRLKGIDTQLWTFLGVRDYGKPIRSHQNPVYVAERERFLSFVARREFDAPSVLWLISIFFAGFSMQPGSMLYFSTMVVLVFVPLVGSTTVAGEYERGSWDPLRSTLIGPGKILRGKLGLTAGQGWIHVIAFYVPPLLLLGLMWLLISYGYQSGAGNFQSWNIYTVWMGHFLVVTVLVLTVFFVASLSIWVSTFHRRSFPALIFAYGSTALFVFGPAFLKMIHPTPGIALGGKHGMDAVSNVLAALNANFVFNLWPTCKQNKTEAVIQIPELFWNLYASHILILLGLSVVCCLWTSHRIRYAE